MSVAADGRPAAGEQRWFAAHAWLPDGPARDVLLTARGGRFVAVTPGAAPGTPSACPASVLPGLADGHGHAFHRALRGRTHAGTGSFWTWRDLAYDVAAVLDPDSYLELARAAYAELVLAGVTCAGEFHYLHHGPGGTPYDDPNAMAEALRQAAARGGPAAHRPGRVLPGRGPVRRRAQPARRGAAALRRRRRRRVGRPGGGAARRRRACASGSRPTPCARSAARTCPRWSPPRPAGRCTSTSSEQPAEVAACRAVHGCSPVRLLADAGVLGPRTTAVHATHVDAADVTLLGGSGTGVCLCPTTERDLADGIGPAAALRDAGSPLSLGSDSHAVSDLLEEARGLEMHERLAGGVRGRFSAADLLAAAAAHDRLGWDDAGRLAVGARADLVAVRLDTVRTAGADPDQVPFAATAADVATVVVDGRTVVEDGRHVLGDVGALLGRAVHRVLAAAGS